MSSCLFTVCPLFVTLECMEDNQNAQRLRKIIGSILTERIQDLGLSLRKVEAKSGVSKTSVSRIVNAESDYSISSFEAVADALGLQPWRVMREAEDRLASAAPAPAPDEPALSVEFTDPAAYDKAVQAKLAAIEQGDYDFAAYTPEITEPDENDDTYWEPA